MGFLQPPKFAPVLKAIESSESGDEAFRIGAPYQCSRLLTAMELQRESVQARLDRLEAPVTYEFCRPVTSRVSYIDFLGPSLEGKPHTDGETAPTKSKSALKRVGDELYLSNFATFLRFRRSRCILARRALLIKKNKFSGVQERTRERQSKTDLCTPFSLGRCAHGDTCRFNHDVVAYLSNKPPDLRGQCPFFNEERCPHGRTLFLILLLRIHLFAVRREYN